MKSSPVRAEAAHEVGPFRVRRIDYEPGLRQPFHTHDTASVTLVLAGEIRETTASGQETGSALSVVVKPPGVRHADEVGPRGARTLQVAFARPGAEALRDGAAEPQRWRWLHGGPGSGPLLALCRALHEATSPAAEMEDLVLEALGGVQGCPPARPGPAPRWLASVREALEDDPFDERSVRDYARLIGSHPVSLSRAFRREYGVTITEYRRRARLRRAAALIIGGAGSLSRAAHAAGYADHPHMCREFRRLARLSPSSFRLVVEGS